MRLVNLDEKNNDRYKVVLSKEDWKKILLGVNSQLKLTIFFVSGGTLIILSLLLLFLYSRFNYLFNSLGLISFYLLVFVFVTPTLLLYFKSVKECLRPFKLMEMEIDVVDKKILLKHKTFSLKDTDTLIFYLGQKREKEKKANGLICSVKKKACLSPINEKHAGQGFLDNNFEEFIILPAEIKYLEDFNLVLGKDGILGIWRQIAELLGVGFEENIEFEERILLKSTQNAFSEKNNKWSSINQENSPLNENKKKEEKMHEVFNLLREKVGGKDTSGTSSLSSPGFGEYMLFREELMSGRMLSTGFELRFWKDYSDFPDKEQIVDKKFVFKRLIRGIVFGIAVSLPMFELAFSREDIVLKTGLYLSGVFAFIFMFAIGIRDIANRMHSKIFLTRITYFLERSGLFMVGIMTFFMGLFEKKVSPKIFLLLLGALICIVVLFAVFFDDLHDFSCPWNLPIDRYSSRIVFSLKDSMLECDYGFCVSRYHWRAPISKIQFLALLRNKESFGTCVFLLVIRIDGEYKVLPLPELDIDKIREILFFLQEIFNTLLAPFYSVNNMESTK